MDNLFFRDFALNREEADDSKRTVPLVFSTETPAMRWMGPEYLLHGKSNVDLDRLRQVGAGLMNHDPRQIVGPVSDVRIKNFQGLATLGFDDDEIGDRAWKKVKSGSLKGVSFAYKIDLPKRIFEGEEYNVREGFSINGPAIIGEKWTPFEITLTPIPLDLGAHVGREAFQRSFEEGCTLLKQPEAEQKIGLPKNHIFRLKLEQHRRLAI